MTAHEAEEASYDLRKATSSLTDWLESLGEEYATGSQPVGRRHLESAAYLDTARTFQDIVEDVQPNQMVRLRVGATAVTTIRFTATPYDRSALRFGSLQPGWELSLKSADFRSYRLGEERRELTVGFGVRVMLSDLAKGVLQGTELSLIDTSQGGLVPILRKPD